MNRIKGNSICAVPLKDPNCLFLKTTKIIIYYHYFQKIIKKLFAQFKNNNTFTIRFNINI